MSLAGGRGHTTRAKLHRQKRCRAAREASFPPAYGA